MSLVTAIQNGRSSQTRSECLPDPRGPLSREIPSFAITAGHASFINRKAWSLCYLLIRENKIREKMETCYSRKFNPSKVSGYTVCSQCKIQLPTWVFDAPTLSFLHALLIIIIMYMLVFSVIIIFIVINHIHYCTI